MPWIIEGSVAIRHFRMFKKADQQGRKEFGPRSVHSRYVRSPND